MIAESIRGIPGPKLGYIVPPVVGVPGSLRQSDAFGGMHKS